MIKENTEPKNEQITSSTTLITSPASTINHTVQQRTNNNNKWKQISLQGLDISPQQNKLTSPTKISTPPLNSAAQRVSVKLTCLVFNRSLLFFKVSSSYSNNYSSKYNDYFKHN